MDHLQEIKSRLPIEELVGSYISLKKAGRSLKGLCPFHHEKTPSFIVSPDKEIAYCFGCQQGGDIFKFIQIVENCDFGEAVKILAEKTGVKLPRALPAWQNKRLKVIEMNKHALRFFKEELARHPHAEEYLIKRGVAAASIRHFELGFSPDSFSALKDHLVKEGFSEAELVEAGLLSQRSMADKSSFDRFRNRLIFPIFDHQGNPIAFGGRLMGEGEPKYLNSPETPAYQKSLVLYGLQFAKEAIKKENRAIVVEGYMDLISAHQAGTKHAVATSGTALTPQQLKLLKRYTPRIVFAFDRDKAGVEATLRAIELAQLAEFSIQILPLPTGKDPDECIQKDPEGWRSAAEHPMAAMDFYFEYAKTEFSPVTMEGKRAMLHFLLPLIKQYPTEMEQGVYLERLSLELKTDIRLLWNDLKKALRSSGQAPAAPSGTEDPVPKNFSREAYLLGFLFAYPHFYEQAHQNLIDNISFDSETKRFYNACKVIYEEEGFISLERIKAKLPPEDHEKIDIYRLLVEEYYPDFSEEAVEREIRNLTRSINQNNLKTIQKEYEFKLRTAETTGDRHLLLNQYNEILKLTSKL